VKSLVEGMRSSAVTDRDGAITGIGLYVSFQLIEGSSEQSGHTSIIYTK
jgi:hypothetical protein